MTQANEAAAAKYEHERTQWLHHQDKMEEELEDTKKKLKQERCALIEFSHVAFPWLVNP